MSDLLWADPEDRVTAPTSSHRKPLKRHVYVKEGSQLKRRCGSVGKSNRATMQKQDLVRIEATEFAADVNACDSCLNHTGLAEVAENLRGGGAETVDFDPFGVFSDE